MGDAIMLRGGGVNWCDYTTTISFPNTNDYSYTLPETLEIDFSNAVSTTVGAIKMGAGYGDTGLRHLIVYPRAGASYSIEFQNQMRLQTITFVGGVKTYGDINNTFRECRGLRSIYGALDFSSSWVNNPFTYCSSLRDITFVPNTLNRGYLQIASNYLTDKSLISIANGLVADVPSHTVQLSSGSKARCSAIMGYATRDISDSYDLFVPDASGEITLMEFITQIKGWTVT